MNSYYYAIYFGAFLTVVAQLLMKNAALKMEKKQSKLRSVLNPLSLLAYLMFVLVTLCTFYGLKKVELMFMILVQPIVMILVLISSSYFFNEKLNSNKILGSIIIIFGVILFNL